MKAIRILTPGWFTTVQDHGRNAFQHMGVPLSGVLDAPAATLANLLVGNPGTAPVLEITVMGPTFEVLGEMDIALTGAEMEITVNDSPCPQWESIRVKPGDKVAMGAAGKGCRGYLALGGGIGVPRIMESAATYVGGKTGGFEGRPLKKDDIIESETQPILGKDRKVPAHLIPDLDAPKILHALPGPQDDFFEPDILFNTPYSVTEKADRMGYRLSGAPLPIL
ncbi:MAG: biotin-dependent carboxyltransferase family protein, partial [Desulfobacterales bacterium]|nr:biotin-dependent carboxyltransferase family protein [Desulfobacterales bacterium]